MASRLNVHLYDDRLDCYRSSHVCHVGVRQSPQARGSKRGYQATCANLTTMASSWRQDLHSNMSLSCPELFGSITASHIPARHFGQARCSSGLCRSDVNSEYFN
jgi:hypothetical protein